MTATVPINKRSLAAYSAGKILPGALLFVAVPVWTRAFGAEQYGLYAIAWSVTLFSSSLTTGWLRQAILRNAGSEGASLSDLPRWTFVFVAGASAVPVGLLMLLQLRHTSQPGAFLLVGVSFAVANSIYTVRQAVAQRDGLSTRFTSAEIIRVILALGLSLLLGAVTELDGAVCVLTAFVSGTCAGILVLVWRAATPSTRTETSLRGDVLRRFWMYGWPMTIWLAASSILLYVDRLIISATLGAESAGQYAAISDVIVRGFAMLTFPLTMVSHPLVMRAWNDGRRQEALASNGTYRKYLLWLAGATVLIGAAVGRPLLELGLSIEVDSPLIVPLLLLGAGLWQAGLMTHKELELTNRTRTMAALIVAIAVVSAGLNILLTPVLGLVGPAAVFALGAGLYTTITALLGASTRRRERR